jgi:peptidoglycan/LPS O-acetylase OafA/YrhL
MRTRDRYIDFLRALALIRVITYHTFDWVWLPAAFPARPGCSCASACGGCSHPSGCSAR